jgi:hypothetical protein
MFLLCCSIKLVQVTHNENYDEHDPNKLSCFRRPGVLVLASASDAGEGPASLLQGGEATPYLTHTSKVCNLNVGLTVTESTISYTVTKMI